MTHSQSDIRTVIFDLGRVLVNIDNTLLVEKLFTNLNTNDLQELAHKTMSDPAMVAFNTGQIDAREFFRRMSQTYGLSMDFDTFKSLWCEIFYTMEGMEELVSAIRQRVTIGLLSDTDPIHWNHIRTTWPWIGAIANPTLSYEVGAMKPSPAIYLASADNVATLPEHCLFVDDLKTNVEGARAVGMQGIQFESVGALAQNFSEIFERNH